MVSSIKLPERESILILILAFFYSIIRLPIMLLMPLVKDEALYAIMIEEQAKNPTLIPTFLGYPMSWKPALFFWVYSSLSHLLPLPLEFAYRLPSFIFGLATLFPLYYTLRNIGASRNAAFFSLLAFIVSFVVVYPNAALLTDTLAFFLISCALYLYTEKKYGAKRFLLAGLIAFAAFFVKLVIAFMVPLLAVTYIYTRERKALSSPVFIISLLAVPLAFLLHYSMLSSAGLAEELFVSDIGGHMTKGESLLGYLNSAIGSMYLLLIGAGIWFTLSIFGFWKFWKENKFMTVWYCLLVFPLIAGFYMPWYFLPVFPAVCFFAVSALLRWDGSEKMDVLFTAFITMALIATVALSAGLYSNYYSHFMVEKEVGLLLSGRENVLVIGDYAIGIIAYKMVPEMQEGGALDMGWIMSTSCNFSGDPMDTFVEDYYSDKYHTIDGSFTGIFTKRGIYRKDTAITDFDYIAVVKGEADIPDATVIYEKPGIIVYQVG